MILQQFKNNFPADVKALTTGNLTESMQSLWISMKICIREYGGYVRDIMFPKLLKIYFIGLYFMTLKMKVFNECPCDLKIKAQGGWIVISDSELKSLWVQ